MLKDQKSKLTKNHLSSPRSIRKPISPDFSQSPLFYKEIKIQTQQADLPQITVLKFERQFHQKFIHYSYLINRVLQSAQLRLEAHLFKKLIQKKQTQKTSSFVLSRMVRIISNMKKSSYQKGWMKLVVNRSKKNFQCTACLMIRNYSLALRKKNQSISFRKLKQAYWQSQIKPIASQTSTDSQLQKISQPNQSLIELQYSKQLISVCQMFVRYSNAKAYEKIREKYDLGKILNEQLKRYRNIPGQKLQKSSNETILLVLNNHNSYLKELKRMLDILNKPDSSLQTIPEVSESPKNDELIQKIAEKNQALNEIQTVINGLLITDKIMQKMELTTLRDATLVVSTMGKQFKQLEKYSTHKNPLIVKMSQSRLIWHQTLRLFLAISKQINETSHQQAYSQRRCQTDRNQNQEEGSRSAVTPKAQKSQSILLVRIEEVKALSEYVQGVLGQAQKNQNIQANNKHLSRLSKPISECIIQLNLRILKLAELIRKGKEPSNQGQIAKIKQKYQQQIQSLRSNIREQSLEQNNISYTFWDLFLNVIEAENYRPLALKWNNAKGKLDKQTTQKITKIENFVKQKKDEIKRLTNKNKQLQKKQKKWQNDNNTINKLALQNKQKASQLADAKKLNNKLAKELDEAKKQNSKRIQKSPPSREENLSAQVKDKLAAISKIEEKNRDLQKNLEQSKQQMKKAQAKLKLFDNLEEQLKEKASQLAELDGIISKQNQHIAKLQSIIAKESSRQNNPISNQQTIPPQTETHIRMMSRKIQELQAQTFRLQGQIEKVNQQKNSLSYDFQRRILLKDQEIKKIQLERSLQVTETQRLERLSLEKTRQQGVKILELENCKKMLEREQEFKDRKYNQQIGKKDSYIAKLSQELDNLKKKPNGTGAHQHQQFTIQLTLLRNELSQKDTQIQCKNAQYQKLKQELATQQLHQKQVNLTYEEELRCLKQKNIQLEKQVTQLSHLVWGPGHSYARLEYIVELIFNILLKFSEFKPQSEDGCSLWNDLAKIQANTQDESFYIQLEEYSIKHIQNGILAYKHQLRMKAIQLEDTQKKFNNFFMRHLEQQNSLQEKFYLFNLSQQKTEDYTPSKQESCVESLNNQ